MPEYIQVQKVPQGPPPDPLQLLATLCYFYPQYTLASARRLPYKHVAMLLKEAQRQQAANYFNLTQIAAAPNTDKGKGVKQLSDHFRKQID